MRINCEFHLICLSFCKVERINLMKGKKIYFQVYQGLGFNVITYQLVLNLYFFVS